MINWPSAAVTFLEVPQLLWRLFFDLNYIYKSHTRIHGIKEVGSIVVFRCLAFVTPMYIADCNCPVIDSCLNRY